MSSLAIGLLGEVSDAGGTVWLEGDTLRLSAPQPLPDHLRTQLGQHKAEIVALVGRRAASVAAPTPIADDGFARIFRAEVADGVEPLQLRCAGSAAESLAADPARYAPSHRMRMAACGTRPRLEHGRPVRLRSAGTLVPARPLGARPADGRP